MDHVSTFAVSTSDAVSEVHCRGTERACRCGATEGFARERRPVGAADQDEGPCRSGGSGSPARVGQVVATPGLRRGTGRAGPRYHALRIARRARRGGGRGGPPLVHRQAADPARLHVQKSRWSPPNAAAQGQGNSAPTGSGIACLRSPPRPTAWSFRTRQREDEPHAPPRQDPARRAADHGCPFRQPGHANADRGLTADALIAPWVIRGAMDRPAFAAHVSKVRVPGPEPGTVVVLDNLTTHRNVEATRALRDHGCWFLHLPPYSPDLNPIEQAFSKLKAHLRRIGARTFTEVFDAIGAICDLFDPQECRNYFTAAGSVSG